MLWRFRKFLMSLNNSLIKPLSKDCRYGKNPGKTMAELGITANTQDELIRNLRTARQSIGEDLGQTALAIGDRLDQVNPVQLDLEASLEPLETAMQEAAKQNDTALLNRLQNVRKALTEELVPVVTADGSVII